jgi:hypothetical protein
MNVTDAEIEAWAQKKYPQFIANKTLIKRLFLIEKGVRFSAPFQPKELRSINQLVVGETADIQAVVVQELSTRSYIGCPNDSKKIPDAIEGKEAVCPKCGQIVKPKSLQWALFLVGDATDEIIASFPPSIMNRPTEGMIIVAQGLLGENEEFLVYRWSLPSDTKPGATPETPLQSFFKPATTPPTTGSLPVTSPPTTATPQVTTPTTATSPPTTPSTSPTSTPVSSPLPTAQPSTTALTCDQCNAGPFESELALIGHKTTHAKKPVKRLKRPGVGSYAPVKGSTSTVVPPTSPMQGPTTTPTSQTTAPTTETTEPTTEITGISASSIAMQATSTATQPPPAPVIEPDSRAVKAAEHAEQAKLPVVPVVEHAKDSLLSTSTMQSPVVPVVPVAQPTTTPTTTVMQGTQTGAKEELKAVEGATLPSIKYTKLSGLIARSLQEFKLQFEASFPKDDMAKAMDAAHCTVVDNKVVFVGG